MAIRTLWGILPLGVILCIQTWLLNLHYPFIGSDMEYYLARLVDVYLHMKINGFFSLQWWTPTFGGGIPAFPNPLHLQFSITPYLMFLFSPWIATQITYGIMTTLGYFLIYNYISKHTHWGFYSAVCTACVFTTNGYFINHILVGHLNYCSFPIIAFVPYLISSSWSANKCIIILSSCITFLIYSAGFPTIFLFYISLGHLFLFLPLVKRETFQFKKMFTVLTVSHFIILGLVCSKFTAVSLHMEVFPRVKEFFSWQPYYQVMLVSTFAQLFSWRMLIPFESFLPIPADSILFWLIGSRYEFWENDVSLSPVVPVFIFFFAIAKFFQIKNFLKIPINRVGIIATLIVIWCSIEMTMGKGLFWSLIKDLPVINSTHVNVRYAGALVLLFSLLFGFCCYTLLSPRSNTFRMWAVSVILFITFLSMSSYCKIFESKQTYRSYDVSIPSSTWSHISNKTNSNKLSEIIAIGPKEQIRLFSQGTSSFLPHDPLFGYHGEFFRSSLSLGPLEKVDADGFYNFHNPITFYNPENASLPREKIHSNDFENFYLFINRKQPNWELPFVQKAANYISLATIFLFSLYIAYAFLKKSNLNKS
jgi:hypothetical protein